MEYKSRPVQPASPVPSVGSADLNNLGVDGEAQARIKQLEVLLKAKNIDNESLEARLREFERERFELYGELEELKNSTEVGGRIEMLEDQVQDLEDQLAQANSRALDIEIKYNRASEEFEKRLASQEKEPAQELVELQEQASAREEQLSAALRSLSGQVGAYESQTKKLEFEVETLGQTIRIKENESDDLWEGLQIARNELKDKTEEYERSSRALRMLSGRIAFLEREYGSLNLQVDSFDMERCELYRENVKLLETISGYVQEIDGLRTHIKKIEKGSTQTSDRDEEFEIIKGAADSTQLDAARSAANSNPSQAIVDTQDLKETVKEIPLHDEGCTPQESTKMFTSTMKFMGLGALATVAVAIASKLCL